MEANDGWGAKVIPFERFDEMRRKREQQRRWARAVKGSILEFAEEPHGRYGAAFRLMWGTN